MTLRARLNLLITLLFIAVFIGAGTYVINHARRSVSEEINSTANLAIQLIELILEGVDAANQEELQRYIVAKFSQLKSTRHLQVAVLLRASPDTAIPPGLMPPVSADAPGWFTRLVEPPPMEFRRVFTGRDVPYTEIVVRADASDEIGEAWAETRGVLMFLILFIVLANVLVYFMLGRDLAPIDSILRGLDRIEQGDYRLRLPQFRIAELTRISEKFNHMADVLARSSEENRILTQRSLEIREQERRHLARELHDELGQSLSAIRAMALSISRGGQDDPDADRSGIDEIAGIAERTYDVTRNMMRRLRPPVLDELGLLTALQELVDSWNAAHGECFCRLNCRGEIDTLADDVRINVYRIIQEGLTNVARHARADQVEVSVDRRSDGLVKVVLKDNGIGFDPGSVSRGLGLLGMKERAQAMNGSYFLTTAPGQGVEIKVDLPGGRQSAGS